VPTVEKVFITNFWTSTKCAQRTYEKGLDSGEGIFLAFKRMQSCTKQGGPTVENFCKTMGVFTIREQVI